MTAIATLRLVVARIRADWVVTAAAALVILVATTLLAAGLIYADAVTLQGLRRALADAPVRDANIEVSTRLSAAGADAADPVLRGAVTGLFPVPLQVERAVQTDTFALPQQPEGAVRNLAIFGAFTDVERHASLVAGAWPVPRAGADGPIQSAIPGRLADELGLRVGDELTMPSRLDPGLVVHVAVSGIYRIDAASDPYWWSEPMALEGATVSPNYTTYGPLLVAPSDIGAVVTANSADVAWRLMPQLTSVDLDGIAPLRAAAQGTESAIEHALGAATGHFVDVSVTSGLPALLGDLDRALLATRTGVLLLLVQLVALAAYALLLTAGLLVEQRRVESAMLHARGANPRQLVVLALLEGLVLAVPAAAVAPWLASVALRLFDAVGPLADIGLRLEPRVSVASYVVAGGGGLLAVLALVAPAVRAARSLSAAARAKGRQARHGMAQRIGLDLALLVAAGVGLWQLRIYGGTLTSQVRGGLGIDPLLVAAPAIGLIAGSILALRLVPLLAQLAEAAVTRRRTAVASLGAWQLARRPLRYSRAALLLTLTVALGGFASLYIATWTGSQRDQAGHEVGADLRVQPDRRAGAIPLDALGAAYTALPGATAAMPVRSGSVSVFAAGGSASVLALDAMQAPSVVAWGADNPGDSLASLMQRLAAGRPELGGPLLPGSPVRLAATVTVALPPPNRDPKAPPPPSPPRSLTIRILLLDGNGLLHQVALGEVPAANGGARLETAVGASIGGAWRGIIGPVRLVALSAGVDLPRAGFGFTGTVTLNRLEASASGSGDDWRAVATGGNWISGRMGRIASGTAQLAPAGPGELAMQISTGTSESPQLLEFAVEQASLPAAADARVPVLANAAFLRLAGVRVGSSLALDLGGGAQPVTVAGTFADFPTTDPSTPLLVADLPTLQAAQALVDGPSVPDAWWIATDGSIEAAAALRGAPYRSIAVLDRRERAVDLQTDPLALGVIGALGLGFIAAALFAAIGFAVSAAVSTRERLTEFAVLRALGLSPGQLAGWLAVEHALLVGVSLLAGTGLGLLLGWLVLPFATMRREPGPVLPPPAIAIPWDGIAILEGVVVAVLLATVLVLVLLLRRVGLGSALRLGED